MSPSEPVRRGPIEAVIFDLDGVLASSIPAHYEAFRRTFAQEGREFRFEEYLEVGAGAARDVLIRRVLGEDLAPAKLAELMAAKERHVRDVIAESGLEAVPGAPEFVQEVARRGLRRAVATSSRTPKLLLEGAGYDLGVFETIVDRTQVEHPKPAPDLFLEAARRLGVDAGRALVIEDSPAGVEAAVRAGMAVVALTTSEPPERLGHATVVVDGYADLKLADWLAASPGNDEDDA